MPPGCFEQGLAAIGALTRATTRQLQMLREAAINTGIETKFSPTEAIEGLRSPGRQAGRQVRGGPRGLVNSGPAESTGCGRSSATLEFYAPRTSWVGERPRKADALVAIRSPVEEHFEAAFSDTGQIEKQRRSSGDGEKFRRKRARNSHLCASDAGGLETGGAGARPGEALVALGFVLLHLFGIPLGMALAATTSVSMISAALILRE